MTGAKAASRAGTVAVSTEIGRRIQELRMQRRLSVRELSAELARIGYRLIPSGVSKVENGDRNVTAADLLAFAAALQVDPSDLLGSKVERPYLSTLRGDAPCQDCGTPDNIVWFTESVFWNEVMRLWGGLEPGALLPSPILCLPCFIGRAEKVGMRPTGWRVLPEWPWRTAERP